MGALGRYPPRRASRERRTCYNCGHRRHYSPSCPCQKRFEEYVHVCGNCSKKGHFPMECPSPVKPKMMTRFVQDQVKEASRTDSTVFMINLVQ